ncbi:MAG TPA: hypothetical protein VIT65_06575 [Microlunatus sp.]
MRDDLRGQVELRHADQRGGHVVEQLAVRSLPVRHRHHRGDGETDGVAPARQGGHHLVSRRGHGLRCGGPPDRDGDGRAVTAEDPSCARA